MKKFILMALLLPMFSVAQQVNQQFNLNGHLTAKASADSVMIMYWPKMFQAEKTIVSKVKAGSFNFHINMPQSIGKIRLIVFSGKGKKHLGDYLIEKGNKISLELDSVQGQLITRFSGKGSINFICQDSLTKIEKQFLSRPKIIDTGIYPRAVHFQFSIQDYLKRSLLAATAFQQHMSDAMAQRIKTDCIGWYANTWMINFKHYLNKAVQKTDKESLIKLHKQFIFPEITNQKIASSSDNYLNYLLNDSKLILRLNNNTPLYTFDELYQLIKKNYTDELRESLLISFFEDPKNYTSIKDYSQQQADLCVQDALKLIRDPELNAFIRLKYGRLKGRSLVPDFTMEDIMGKKKSLSDYQNKVVLLDVYGEGCGGCADFSSMFEREVYPLFKYEPDFVIISISIDQTKERWLRGLNSGKYTQSTHTNLWTEGKGTKHPFLEYYNIEAIPFILLIDKDGKLNSALQPGLSSTELIRLIHTALKSNFPDSTVKLKS